MDFARNIIIQAGRVGRVVISWQFILAGAIERKGPRNGNVFKCQRKGTVLINLWSPVRFEYSYCRHVLVMRVEK